MKKKQIILFLLISIGCNDLNKSSILKNDKIDLNSDISKEVKEKEQKGKEVIQTDTTNQVSLEQKLGSIRQNFKRINKIKTWTKTDKRELEESTEGGVATYFFLKDTLLKIVAINFGETGKSVQEYYTMNNELSFVFEQAYSYNRPITWDSTTMIENNDDQVFDLAKSEVMEDRSYFEKGTLIRQVNNQDCGSPFSEDYLKEEEFRLKTGFKDLVDKMEK
ncbi:MAG: hypothetical protein R2825_01045 [Saprospiraceae bacterium]